MPEKCTPCPYMHFNMLTQQGPRMPGGQGTHQKLKRVSNWLLGLHYVRSKIAQGGA